MLRGVNLEEFVSGRRGKLEKKGVFWGLIKGIPYGFHLRMGCFYSTRVSIVSSNAMYDKSVEFHTTLV